MKVTEEFGIEKESLALMRNALKQIKEVEEVIIFGSRAMGTEIWKERLIIVYGSSYSIAESINRSKRGLLRSRNDSCYVLSDVASRSCHCSFHGGIHSASTLTISAASSGQEGAAGRYGVGSLSGCMSRSIS
ncbi:hypothetical protein ABMB67_001391 [Halalkalibacter oceani]